MSEYPNEPDPLKFGSSHSYQVHPDNCFSCGSANPQGLALDFDYSATEEKILTLITFGSRHSNTPVTVHGGVLATIMDEAMGILCSHLGYIVLTSQLQVHYKKVVDIGKPYQLKSWNVSEDRRYLHNKAVLLDLASDRIHVEAGGAFRKVPERFFGKFFDTNSSKFKAIMKQVTANSKIRNTR